MTAPLPQANRVLPHDAHGLPHDARVLPHDAHGLPHDARVLPHDARVLPHGARVLLIRLSALGDLLFALETLAALKAERPDVVCDFLVEDRFANLLQGHPQIARVLVFPRRRKRAIPAAVRALRAYRYDAVLDLHGILKSGLQLWLTRAKRKLGYRAPAAREGADLLYRERVSLPLPLPHRAERGLFLLRALGLSARETRAVLPDSARSVDPFGIGSGVSSGVSSGSGSGSGSGVGSGVGTGLGASTMPRRPRVVLHPGASTFGAFKRWPIERFAELARRLVARNFEVAVSYGPGEHELFTAVRAQAPQVVPIAGAELGLVGLADAYRHGDLMVAADTGPLHLAAAAGVRVVALFGPKDPALYGPRGPGHRVLFRDVPCRPCMVRDCVSPQCVLGVSVEEVEAAVLAAIEEGVPSSE